jgi:hypothetical protein
VTVRPLNGQTIIGKVLNDSNGEPIRVVDIQLLDAQGTSRARVVSDTSGQFHLVAPVPGKYSLRAALIGYATTVSKPLELKQGLELHIEVRLNTQAVPHEPLRVVAERTYRVGRLGEYYQRASWTRKSGFGRVLMRDDLERLRGATTSSILRRYPPRAQCSPVVLLDGLRLSADEMSLLDSMARPEDIEGIEFYRGGNEIPIEYATRSSCGLVLIWTRRDVENGRPFTWKRLFIALGLVAGIVAFSRR